MTQNGLQNTVILRLYLFKKQTPKGAILVEWASSFHGSEEVVRIVNFAFFFYWQIINKLLNSFSPLFAY